MIQQLFYPAQCQELGLQQRRNEPSFCPLWLMGTRVSTWAYSIHSELCHAPGHRIWERMQGESPQPHLLGRGVSRNGYQWRQEERVFLPEKGALVYTVFQMEGTASAKVQGLGRGPGCMAYLVN